MPSLKTIERVCVADKQVSSEEPEQPLMEECYLNVLVEHPKPPLAGRGGFHSYAEQHNTDDEWQPDGEDADGEAGNDCSPPPSPPPSNAIRGRGRGVQVRVLSSAGHGRDERLVTSVPSRGRPSTQSRVTRAQSAALEPRPAPPPLQLPAGRLTQYMVDVTAKRQQIRHLQTTYNALLDKGQFRNAYPDWAEKIPGPAAGAPLLTLRDGRAEREPPLASVDSLSADTLLPLAPNDAWEAVATLRLQVLELQVALMNSRIQAMDGELRLQEANTIHRRYKADVRDERRQAEQSHKTAVRQLERRTNQPCVHCAHWPFKMRQLEKKTNKRIRRAEALGKCLEQVFTPMQLRVIRTGKKPRWAEEDIRRAIELKKVVSHRGYSYIRNSFKIPLPTPMIISRGAERFTALKPLFDEMVVANARKLSDNKRPGPKKDGCEVKEVRKRKTDASPAGKRPRVESSAAERPLVKRRKKRPPALPPHPPLPPNAYEVEFVARDAPAEVVIVTSPAAAAPHRAGLAGPRGTPRLVRPSWDCARLWDDGDEQTLEELTRPRDRPAWSADTAGLR